MKNLFLVEGLSAQSGLVASFGRDGNAFFAMRGVPLNSWECTHQQMTANKELSMVYKIIKNSPDDIRIVIASDNDLDGKKIAGLMIAFFKRYMGEMFDTNRICLLSTPIASAVDAKGKIKSWVYSFNEIASLGSNIRYHKGLGSWTADKLKHVITKDGIDKMIQPITAPKVELLNDWFIGDNADRRKQLIESAPAFDIMSL
jgi:topoisomerase-4 subunit B